MMSKKVKMAPLMEPSPSSSLYHTGDKSRARFKHDSLLQDYHDLQKETESKRKQLLRAKQMKLKLESEIKFLRRKFKKLTENPAKIGRYGLKKKSVQNGEASSSRDGNQIKSNGISIRERKVDRDFPPRSSCLIDLNQACFPIGDEMDEFNVGNETVRPDKMKNYYMENEEAMSSDVKISICRDRKGKRKMTWQDHVALRV